MFKSTRDVDVNEHERLSNITLRHKLKQRNSTFIAVVHFSHSLEYYIYMIF